MTAPAGAPALIGERWVCVKCAGLCGAHYLTCPLLRLPADVPLYEQEDQP